MKAKKKVNRRRAKSKDAAGNMAKVKVDKQGNVKRFKYAVDGRGMSRMDAVSKSGKLHQDVMARRKQRKA